MSKQLSLATLASTALAVLITSPIPVGAQTLEEVVVTARKREETLQEVPISLLAFDGEALQQDGIIDFQMLAPYTPNFSYAQATGASDILIMRGLGTIGSGPHFEQAVGQVFNGFFTTRSRLGRTALIDLEQVEVLRGPQGAIIGKNTSLGAINITSKKPTDEFEASVFGGYDFDASEGYEIQGIVSGPLGDRVGGRAVVNWTDRDGWVENRALGDDHSEREDLTTRLIVDAELVDNVRAELLWQHSDFERNGKHREVYKCFNPDTAGSVAGFDCKINASNQSVALVNGVDVGEPFELDSDLYGLTIDWTLANFTVTSLTGFAEYEIFDQFDSDQRPIESRRIFNDEDYEQFSQEFRITSTGENIVDYIAGFLYMTNEMDFIQNSDFDPAPGPPGTPAARRSETAGTETDTWSVFGQVDWHLNEAWTLTLGGRWTDEERDGFKAQVMNDIHTNNVNTALCAGGFRACTRGNDGTGALGDPIVDEIDEDDFSWNAALQWDINDNNRMYWAAATGFKSGGFDLRGAGDPANFVFDEEESTNLEWGGRHTLVEGTVRANWTLYWTNVDGLQLSSNDPITVTQTVNNGEATAWGLEGDLLWAATDALNLGLVAAYLDTEYDDFDGACYWQQTFETGCNIDFDGNGTFDAQDQSGDNLAFAPEMSLVASGDYTWSGLFGGGLDLTAAAKWIFVDDQDTQVDNNPLAEQDSYNKIDASLTLASADGRWYVALVGRNLTDETVYHFSSGTTACPGGPGPGQTSCLFATTEETRAIALRGQFNFR